MSCCTSCAAAFELLLAVSTACWGVARNPLLFLLFDVRATHADYCAEADAAAGAQGQAASDVSYAFAYCALPCLLWYCIATPAVPAFSATYLSSVHLSALKRLGLALTGTRVCADLCRILCTSLTAPRSASSSRTKSRVRRLLDT